MSSAPHYPSYPIPLSGKTKTKRKFDHGFARNGIHEVNMHRREVYMEIAKHSGRCHDCQLLILEGEIYGQGDMFQVYCRECIIIPTWARVYEITYSLGRKSKQNPDGTKTFTVVMSSAKLNAFTAILRTEKRSFSIMEY